MHFTAIISLASSLALVSAVLTQTEPQGGGILEDPGFESYTEDASVVSWKPKQGEPWKWTGWFRLARSLNVPWGNIPSVDGTVYAIMKRESSIEQTITGLVKGKTYAVSWSQRGRTDWTGPSGDGLYGGGNDLNLSIDGENKFSDANIPEAEMWDDQTSDSFVATSDTAVLKFWSTNPKGGDRSTFIDAISVNMIADPETASLILDPGFESYYDAIIANTGRGGSDWLGPGLAAQEPWNYRKGFRLGKSGNTHWGGVPSYDGSVYAILQNRAMMKQTVSGLVPGSDYTVSWFQRGWSGEQRHGLKVKLGGSYVYTETDISAEGGWVSRTSAVFTATRKTTVLKFVTPRLEGKRAVFIDAVSINMVSQ